MADNRPIGVFDSGVGGLSIMKEIRVLLPSEDIIYYADSAYCPYGGKDPDFIHRRTVAISKFLLDQGAKIIVVACNTASAAGLEALRMELQVPIVGVEPAVKPAVKATRNGKVGVLATGVTLNSSRFNTLVERFCGEAEIITQPCPGLVEKIEDGKLDEAAPLLKEYLDKLLEQGAGTIVLGCTHYPFMRSYIEEVAGSHILVIDTGNAVARQVVRVMEQFGLCGSDKNGYQGTETFFTSANPSSVNSVIGKLWGRNECEVKQVSL